MTLSVQAESHVWRKEIDGILACRQDHLGYDLNGLAVRNYAPVSTIHSGSLQRMVK